MKKIEAKAAVRVLRELSAGIATKDEISEALQEIEETDFEAPAALPDPFARFRDKGDEG